MVHVDQLCGKIEIPFEIGAVDNIDDYIGIVLSEIGAHITLLGRIGREGIRAGEIDYVETVAAVGECARF